MGWAKKNMSSADLESIFRSLVKVEKAENGELWAVCPFHGDTDPSLSYNIEDDVFGCLGCQAGGDIIDFWSQIEGINDKSEAFKAFRAKFANGAESPAKVSEGGPAHTGRKDPPAPVIHETVWEKMGPLPEAWIKDLEQIRGWSPEVMTRMDLRQETVWLDRGDISGGDDGTVKPVNSAPYRIAIPVRDDNGRLMNVRRYRKPGSKAKSKIMSWGAGYGSARLLPPGSKLGEGNVYLCEGEPDMLCALSKGLNAITQTGKLKRWPDSMLAPFRGRDVVICFDADVPGREHGDTAAANLVRVASSVRILTWPPFMGQQANGDWPLSGGEDLTDFFVKHGKTVQDFQELVAQAKVVEKPAESAPEGGARQFFSRGSTGRVNFRPRLLANQLIQDCPLLHDPETSLLYRWTGQFFEPFHEDQVKLMAMHHLGAESARDKVNDAVFQARILSTVPRGRRPNDRGNWICLKDGMLDLDSGQRKPHDKGFLATYQIPVALNPKKTSRPERWLKFLEETIQTEGPIKQLQEFMGYCLTKDVRYEKCLLLLGHGGDGKSKVMTLIKTLVGHDNVSAVRFQDLDNEFQRASIYCKLVNMATELGSRAMESDIFKAIVSGDPISAAYKHRDGFTFEPFCKLVFSMNRLPRVLDNSDGLFRRLLPISFKRQFLEEDPDRDPDLKEKLLDELPGIFEWALAGLARLREQRGFTMCDETREMLQNYRVLNNPVAAFVEERCDVKHSSASAVKEDLYKSYVEYAKDGNYRPLGKENFFVELYSVIGSRREYRPRKKDGSRPRSVMGISLVVMADTSGGG